MLGISLLRLGLRNLIQTMPPKVVKRGSAAKKAKVSSKTAIQNQQQEPEPEPEPIQNHEDNHVVDAKAEENSVETVPNGVAMVESESLFLFLFFMIFFILWIYAVFLIMFDAVM